MDRCSRTAMLSVLLAAQSASAAFVTRSGPAEIATHVTVNHSAVEEHKQAIATHAAVNHSAVEVHKQATATHAAVNHSAVAVHKQAMATHVAINQSAVAAHKQETQVSNSTQVKKVHEKLVFLAQNSKVSNRTELKKVHSTAGAKPVFLAQGKKALVTHKTKLEPTNFTATTSNATVESGIDSSDSEEASEEANATKAAVTDTRAEEDNATTVVNASSTKGGTVTKAKTAHRNSSEVNATHVTLDSNATSKTKKGKAGRNSTKAVADQKEVTTEDAVEVTMKAPAQAQTKKEEKEKGGLSKDELCAVKMRALAVRLGRSYTNAHLESTLVSYCVTSAEFPAARHLEDNFGSKSRCEAMAKQLTCVRMDELSAGEESTEGYVQFCKTYYGETTTTTTTKKPRPVPPVKAKAASLHTVSHVCVAAFLLVSASFGSF